MVLLVVIMMKINLSEAMWMDEYMVYRLIENLPEYKTDVNWVYDDRPELLRFSTTLPSHNYSFYATFYNSPYSIHNPLEMYFDWPLVKLTDILAEHHIIRSLDEQRYMDSAEDQIIILRSFMIVIVVATMTLIYLIAYKRVKGYAVFSVVPYLLGRNILYGAFQMQWDVWMMLFLFLTWFWMDYYPESKWKYVFGCMLVNTKMFLGVGLAGLLGFKKWKMFLCIISIIPFFIASYYGSGELWRWFTRTQMLSPYYYDDYTSWVFPTWFTIFKSWNLWFFGALLIPMVVLFKKYFVYCLFYLFSVVYAFLAGVSICHVVTLLYGAAILFPLVVHWMFQKDKKEIQIVS